MSNSFKFETRENVNEMVALVESGGTCGSTIDCEVGLVCHSVKENGKNVRMCL